VGAGTAANIVEGTAYWESDTDMLTIGDGATGISLDFTAGVTYTFPTASKTLASNDGSNLTISGQAIGDIPVASSTTAYGKLADVAAGQPLLSGGVGAAPAYAGWTVTGTATKTYVLPATTMDLVGHLTGAVTTNALMKFSGTTGTEGKASTIVEDGTDVNIQALNLLSTGVISGMVKVITTGTGFTIGTSPATVSTDRVVYGGAIFATTTATIVLPAVSVGMSVCIYSPAAAVITVDPNASDGIRNATAARNADGHQIVSGGVAGDYVCLLGDSTDGWTVFGKSGTWTDE
jgi:hypothetical protein